MNLFNALRFHPFKMLFIILAVFIGTHQESLSVQNAEAEKQAKEKAIADRIAFEKDRAQKQIAQKEEDGRKAALREKKQAQRQIPSLHQQQRSLQQQSSSQTQAPQNSFLQDGRTFASSLLGTVTGAAKSTNPQLVPRFQTDKPKEASLDNGSIGDAALAESRSNQASQHLYGQAKDRQSFKVDPTTDPLFVEANQAIANPQKTLNDTRVGDTRVNEEIEEVKGELEEEESSEELKTCEESGEEYQQSCSKHLEIVLKVIPERGYTTPKTCIGHWKSRARGTKYWCAGCRGGNYVKTQAKKVETLKEEWVDGCAVLEDLTEKGLCRYVSASRSPQNETRTIQGEPITRDHFEEHYNYACFKASPQSCAGLREQGCFQVKSRCKENVGNQCVLWEQTYSCPSGKRAAKRYRSSNGVGSLFCLTGDCADTSYQANNELLNVMSHLYALREAQNDLRNFKVIFKGNPRWCTRNCVDFRDCCGSGNGWGVALHLSSCDAQEIEIRTLRDKNLCIQVGTYCAEKLLGVCIRKKTGFCCYGTKMARLIQQQGRAQLGLGFGSPESPDCAGLSPEQLSQLDFSRINFSEIFEDIKNQTVAKGQGQSLAQVSTERLQNNMTLLTKPSLDPKSIEELQKLKEKGL